MPLFNKRFPSQPRLGTRGYHMTIYILSYSHRKVGEIPITTPMMTPLSSSSSARNQWNPMVNLPWFADALGLSWAQVNQIGSVTESIAAWQLCKDNKYLGRPRPWAPPGQRGVAIPMGDWWWFWWWFNGIFMVMIFTVMSWDDEWFNGIFLKVI